MIYGSRVQHARLLLGETQKRFAEVIGLAQSRLSALERGGGTNLPDAIVIRLTEHTAFPHEFFEQPPLPSIEEVQFRARLTSKAAERNQVVACADLIHESFVVMRSRLEDTEYPPLPRLRDSAPHQTAEAMRSFFDQPSSKPVRDLMLALERKGVLLLALPIHGNKHDALSWWQPRSISGEDRYPVIVTLMGTSGDRLRWNVAHELGHLVLHDGEYGRDAEAEADAFAAEFLTPLVAMRAEIPNSPRLASLYAMKVRWGVSVQSLVRRARDIGALDDDQYMSLFRQISARGERMNERYQIEREKPRRYRRMAEVLFGDPAAPGLAALCRWTPEFAADVLGQFASRTDLPTRRRLVNRGPVASVTQLRPRSNGP